MTCKYCKWGNMAWEIANGWDSCSVCHLLYEVMGINPADFPPRAPYSYDEICTCAVCARGFMANPCIRCGLEAGSELLKRGMTTCLNCQIAELQEREN
ncbi:hypothetical protein GCM10022252_19950 [Streptosporangium oxazolinicum]|uniref:Uncharacterized protein n=1 Tax=Streptosporangium oxazolinicum TaxID=909287 RepID=A0ABP8ANV7_9ACTN